MTSLNDVGNYIKAQTKFVGKVFLATLVGGVAGSATQGTLGILSPVPLVASSAYNLGALGATLGFIVTFLSLLVAQSKS